MALLKRVIFPFSDPVETEADASIKSPEPGHETATQICATRHDHHNIEIKTSVDLTSQQITSELDVYLFVPRNFEITGLGKTELQKDLRTRVRLAVPISGERGLAALESAKAAFASALVRLKESAESGELVVGTEHPVGEELVESAKELCAIVGESLKQAAAEHTRHFFLAHSLMSTPNSCWRAVLELVASVRRVRDMITGVRTALYSGSTTDFPVLGLMDEYLSQLYVKYLGTVLSELERIPTRPEHLNTEPYVQTRKGLDELLKGMLEAEALHRRNLGWAVKSDETEIDRERRLIRMSHLKKFFQSKSFVDVAKETPAKRMTETTALLGTAFAGVVAALFQSLYRPDLNVTVQSFSILAFGVTAYVLRDRMKDWAKSLFHEKARQYIPDYEQHLWAKSRKIGEVKEWYKVSARPSVPDDILQLRMTGAHTPMERQLPEDVFHFKKVQETFACGTATEKGNSLARALHENIRINFERYLKHMDDPFKELMDLDANGQLKQSRSHRVYHFYICVRQKLTRLDTTLSGRLRAAPPPILNEQSLLARVVLDKNGIVRIEDLS